jgi:hypothetical protein
MSIIRTERAEPDFDRLNDSVIALVKGMLARGDKQSDIAACFLINSGRVAEINRGDRGPHVVAAKNEALPPPGPYPSPYHLWEQQQTAWRARVALEAAMQAIQLALVALHKIEQQ